MSTKVDIILLTFDSRMKGLKPKKLLYLFGIAFVMLAQKILLKVEGLWKKKSTPSRVEKCRKMQSRSANP